MRVHLLAVPNTRTTSGYELDGFCTRTILFARLLKRLGHTVILYGVHENTAPCDEFVSCMSAEEQAGFIGETAYQTVPFEPGSPLFLTFNARASTHLAARKRPGDVIATIAGQAQQLVAEHHPELRCLEYSIGYQGIFAPFRIFESHVWRHVVHGFSGVLHGRTFDGVIPPWWPADQMPACYEPEPYVAYCGRIVSTKGVPMVCQAAREAGVKLVLMGFGDLQLITYGEFLGPVGHAERDQILSKATAVLMPTQYIEPFGNVAAEAQLCGTPVISTDFGAFVESVAHGVSGYRCTTLGEFVQAIDAARDLDRRAIRQRALRLYSEDTAAASYAAYFTRLDVAQGDGAMSRVSALEGVQVPV